ncbi:hypothetical protein BN6_55230 [Saccharothrix espanaensis DSM 44229]|uniref:Uncharacterized protein n=1 Tax=Saccharothrix espanaensis (strain ATCC 51144 / DSM 44229 / JCM 9112 / NBRC 15066 / NRRL 15764) TaxID=1179773 RepID=K0K5B6_SACES|nr:hypothetical protein BN6_55230 [Saccharothrix espanaensis DSM 44229]
MSNCHPPRDVSGSWGCPQSSVVCGELEADGRTVFGDGCDTEHWGGLDGFTLSGPGRRGVPLPPGLGGGSLWVRRGSCRQDR